MDKKQYYIKVSANISILKGMNVTFPKGDYFCPLCKGGFSEDQVSDILTEEDVPQHSLGGARITLTCRDCNSSCGHKIDSHLLNYHKALEQKLFLPGTDRNVELKDGENVLRAELRVHSRDDMQLCVNTKHNNPKFWEYFHDNILLPNNDIYISNRKQKHDLRQISAAILKNAYLLLFAKTGYSFLFDPYYDKLREQIMNPNAYILPERLWTEQSVNLADGIYLTTDNHYRGFFVVYSLILKQKYKVCCLIPTPKVDYLEACMHLRGVEPGTTIQLKLLPCLNFHSDINAVQRLRNWCYGWNSDL